MPIPFVCVLSSVVLQGHHDVQQRIERLIFLHVHAKAGGNIRKREVADGGRMSFSNQANWIEYACLWAFISRRWSMSMDPWCADFETFIFVFGCFWHKQVFLHSCDGVSMTVPCLNRLQSTSNFRSSRYITLRSLHSFLVFYSRETIETWFHWTAYMAKFLRYAISHDRGPSIAECLDVSVCNYSILRLLLVTSYSYSWYKPSNMSGVTYSCFFIRSKMNCLVARRTCVVQGINYTLENLIAMHGMPRTYFSICQNSNQYDPVEAHVTCMWAEVGCIISQTKIYISCDLMWFWCI